MRFALALLALLSLAIGGVPGVGIAAAETMDGGRLGNLQVASPPGEVQDFVVLLSDRAGWTQADAEAAASLAAKGALVVGVDTPAYLKRLDATEAACQYGAGDIDDLSRQVQRERGTTIYRTPIVVGVGAGGALAERILAQAPPNTIAGALALNPTGEVAVRVPFCAGPPGGRSDDSGAPAAGHPLEGFWSVGLTADGSAGTRDALTRLPAATVLDLPAKDTEANDLLALAEGHLSGSKDSADDVSGLPLIELPASKPSGLLAVVMSGDGGWRDLDKTIAEDLHNQNVSVVGLDSLRYFWSAKTPEETAADLAKVLRVYAARWHATHVALIGYSFGADVLPFAYNRLPTPLRAKVSLLALLGFTDAADFEIRVAGWLGLPPSQNARPVLPEMARIPPSLVQCYYGVDEDDTACPRLADRGVTEIRTGGGHHFDGNYEALAQQILSFWRRHIVPSPISVSSAGDRP